MRDLAEAIILTEDLSRKTSDGVMVDREVESD
jgi:hypothetical protein